MAKKAKKTTKKRVRRKQCATKGCRKLCVAGSDMCAPCEKKQHEVNNPQGAVLKISAVRAMRWEVLETQLRNHGQGVQLLNQEMELSKRDFIEAQRKRALKKESLLAAGAAVKAEYEKLTREIAQEFELDPMQMSIDPDTCVVHDLRKE